MMDMLPALSLFSPVFTVYHRFPCGLRSAVSHLYSYDTLLWSLYQDTIAQP